MADFAPRTAVITGGASGIGLAIAKRLVKRDARVIVADRNEVALERADQLDGIIAKSCDVSDLTQVEVLAETAFEQLGSVDLVVNNAGEGGVRGKLWEIDPEDARAHFDINLWGVWNGCRAFAPRLIEQGTVSAIYNTGSENSFFCAVPQTAAYIAAKHAVLGMTESLREDLPEYVHAGLIVPGWVYTPLGPEQFMKWGMDVEVYVDIILPQILARRRFVVSHGYNTVRISERMDALMESYAAHALSVEEDEQHDVRLVFEKLSQS